MPSAQPLVSIVTPVLNGRKYLEEYVRSVLDQSYRHIEQVFDQLFLRPGVALDDLERVGLPLFLHLPAAQHLRSRRDRDH